MSLIPQVPYCQISVSGSVRVPANFISAKVIADLLVSIPTLEDQFRFEQCYSNERFYRLNFDYRLDYANEFKEMYQALYNEIATKLSESLNCESFNLG